MKSKKILTILLSLAIMFTFMPAMAFADTEQVAGGKIFKWSSDFSSVTYDGSSTNVTTEYTFSSGVTTAVAKYGTGESAPTSTVYFIDLKGAEIKAGPTWTNAEYVAANKQPATILLRTTCDAATNKLVANGAMVEVDSSDLNGWNITYVTDDSLVATADTTAKVSIAWEASNKSLNYEDGLTANAPKLINAPVADKTVNVTASSTAVNDFYTMVKGAKKTFTSASPTDVYYDGAEHEILIDDMAHFTLAVKTQDPTTGAWRAATAADMKYLNAGDKINLKAEYTPADAIGTEIGASTKTLTFTVNGAYDASYADKKARPTFAWTTGNSSTGTTDGGNFKYDLTTEQAADPTAFITVSGGLTDADTAELKAVWNEFYTIKVTDNAANSNFKTWTVAKKYTDAYTATNFDATTTAVGKAYAAVKKEHAQLFANYKIGATFLREIATTDKITVKVTGPAVVNDKDDDISFEGQTSFTYSGKKTTKKGVLKAKKTITVKATADSGNAITYVATKTAGGKITVSAAGKITVKKGLKKGTYKVTVKAKTAAGNGYKAASEKQTYVIKIKK